jgi:hypothetical protein
MPLRHPVPRPTVEFWGISNKLVGYHLSRWATTNFSALIPAPNTRRDGAQFSIDDAAVEGELVIVCPFFDSSA